MTDGELSRSSIALDMQIGSFEGQRLDDPYFIYEIEPLISHSIIFIMFYNEWTVVKLTNKQKEI